MYRPKDWKNGSYDCSVCDTEPEGCPGCGSSAYEAGADAYEEALKSSESSIEVFGGGCSMPGFMTDIRDYIVSLGNGVWVFIPGGG